ncbi:MAG: EF-hand domain-containing protein [Dongiaceae bacterium]
MISGGIGGLGGLGHLRHELFNKLDANQSGGIEETEFVEGLTSQNANLSEDTVKKVFAAFDSDSDGVLSEKEFKTGYQRLSSAVKGALIGLQEAPPPPPSPNELFANADSDSSGDLSEAEFVAGAPDGPHKPSEDELKQLFAALDTDGSGTVSEDEFKAGFRRHGPPPPPQAGNDNSDSNPLLALVQDSASTGVNQQDLNTLFTTLFKLQSNSVSTVSTSA